MKNILITGVSGFVGSKLAEALLGTGEYQIVGVSRLGKGFLSKQVLGHPRFTLLNTDLSQRVPKELALYDIQGVVHLASRQPSNNNLTWEDYYNGNVQTTRSILSFVKEKKPGVFVYLSSTAVLGLQMTLSESTPVHPSGYYGLTKYIAERLVEIELKNSTVKGVILRCPSLVGRAHKGGLVYTYYELARQGKDIEIFSDGKRLRNVFHVDDLVKAIGRMLTSFGQLDDFELFQLGASDSRTMYDIARLIKEKIASSSILKPIAKTNPGDGDVLLDVSHAKASWGFSAITVEETIEKYIGEMNA